jgi:hypothetical protein
MASLIVAPSVDEWRLGQAEYEALVARYQVDGFDAWLQEPRDGQYGSGGIVTDPLIDVSLFLWEHVTDATVSAVVALAIERLVAGKLRRQKRKRRGVLYGPGGEVLRKFELDSDMDDDQPS